MCTCDSDAVGGLHRRCRAGGQVAAPLVQINVALAVSNDDLVSNAEWVGDTAVMEAVGQRLTMAF